MPCGTPVDTFKHQVAHRLLILSLFGHLLLDVSLGLHDLVLYGSYNVYLKLHSARSTVFSVPCTAADIVQWSYRTGFYSACRSTSELFVAKFHLMLNVWVLNV